MNCKRNNVSAVDFPQEQSNSHWATSFFNSREKSEIDSPGNSNNKVMLTSPKLGWILGQDVITN